MTRSISVLKQKNYSVPLYQVSLPHSLQVAILHTTLRCTYANFNKSFFFLKNIGHIYVGKKYVNHMLYALHKKIELYHQLGLQVLNIVWCAAVKFIIIVESTKCYNYSNIIPILPKTERRYIQYGSSLQLTRHSKFRPSLSHIRIPMNFFGFVGGWCQRIRSGTIACILNIPPNRRHPTHHPRWRKDIYR